MLVKSLNTLTKGYAVPVLNGKGQIQIDFKANKFLALVKCNNNYAAMNLHETIEEAIQEVLNYEN